MNVRFAEGEYVPRRGGNYNNTSNAGLGYENCNNVRGNANANYAGRPRSRSNERMAVVYATPPRYELGGVRFLPRAIAR